MKNFETLQREMLRDLRQSQNWIAAEVNHGDAETIKYACEIRIPTNADVMVYQSTAYTIISELGIAFEVDIYTLKLNGAERAILLTIEDPKLVKELTTCKDRDIGMATQATQYFMHEREQNSVERAKDVSAFKDAMKGETMVSYHLFPDMQAVRTGASYKKQTRENYHVERLLKEVSAQEQAEEGGIDSSSQDFRR